MYSSIRGSTTSIELGRARSLPSSRLDHLRAAMLPVTLESMTETRRETASGIELRDVYGPEHLEGFDLDADLGAPGSPPFTRGIHPSMYRSRLWTMRQYAGMATAEETNRRFRYLLEHGQTGLSVAFDLPTQMGYDSDAPEAEGEVGRVGVPIASLADMETLLAGIPLGEVSTSMTINATAAILLALYVAAAEKQGVRREPRLPRSWRSPSPTGSPTSRQPSRGGSTSTASRAG